MSNERTYEDVLDDKYENRMKFSRKTDLSNFEDLEEKFLELDGHSYGNLGCSYTGYGNIELDRKMPEQQAQGVFKYELKRFEVEEEGMLINPEPDEMDSNYERPQAWDGIKTDDWRYIGDHCLSSLRQTAKEARCLTELNKSVKKLNKVGTELTSEHSWFSISPIGHVKLKEGLSVQEVIGILKFETDMMLCC